MQVWLWVRFYISLTADAIKICMILDKLVNTDVMHVAIFLLITHKLSIIKAMLN